VAGLTRVELRRLAESTRGDAALLLAHGRWAMAYYLFGLAVEVAIKAAAAKHLAAETVPDRSFSGIFYSHKLRDLIGLAQIRTELEQSLQDPQFRANWEIVRAWTNDSRYENVVEAQAVALANAVDDRKSGVLQWLKRHW
jgi:hypothetical protein